MTLGPVSQKAAKICRKKTNDSIGEALAIEAEQWAKDRNNVLHAIAKSGQGFGPRIPAEKFVGHAHAVDVGGVELVMKIKDWHRKQISKAKHPMNCDK